MTKGSDGGGWLSHREEKVVVIVKLRRGENIVPKPKDWAATTVRDYRRDQARENQKAAVDYRLQGSLRRRRRQILVRVHRSVVARLGKDHELSFIRTDLYPTSWTRLRKLEPTRASLPRLPSRLASRPESRRPRPSLLLLTEHFFLQHANHFILYSKWSFRFLHRML